MLAILHAFAECYRKSASGRRAPARDHTIDYEKFLRFAGAADSDEREIAERELAAAELESGGLFRIDRQPKSGIPIRLRLSASGGEEWLFGMTGVVSPEEKRQRLAADFRHFALTIIPEPWRQAWNNWFLQLAERALRGESVQPFRREDPDGNLMLFRTLAGVLHWQGPSLVRYASSAICGDSKKLQSLEPRLLAALGEITGFSSLEDFGIFRKPRSITFHGPLALTLFSRTIDFSIFPAAVALSESNIVECTGVTTNAPFCLTVENEDTFHELASTNPGVLLILTSYPGSAVLRLIQRLPDGLAFHHFGDSDPAGSDILRDLREKTGRSILPVLMGDRPPDRTVSTGKPLSEHDKRTIQRLLGKNEHTDLHSHLRAILDSGTKGSFEQESIPVAALWKAMGMEARNPQGARSL